MPLFPGLTSFGRATANKTRARLSFFRRNTSGGVAAVVAILSPVFIGAMGLGSEAGYWYLTQRKVQNAADVAAHATAVRLNSGETLGELQNLAEFVVGNSDVNIDMTTVALNNPPLSGGYIEDANAVEVVLTRTVPRMFSSIYGEGDIVITARAVAAMSDATTACILALSEDDDDEGIDISGSAIVNVTNCDIVSNKDGPDSLEIADDSMVTANCVQAAGDTTVTATLIATCGPVQENVAPFADPFATLPEPSLVGACRDKSVSDTMVTPAESHPSGMNSIRYCDGLEVDGNVTLNPGLYLIENGDFIIKGGANVFGTGVVFFVSPDVQVIWENTAMFNISGATTGPYAGMLLFGDRDADDKKHSINGLVGSMMSGAIYAKMAELEMFGGVSTSFAGCTQIVVDDIDIKNDAFVNLHCLFPTGPTASTGGTVAIVE